VFDDPEGAVRPGSVRRLEERLERQHSGFLSDLQRKVEISMLYPSVPNAACGR
jgi:hypothetical protein